MRHALALCLRPCLRCDAPALRCSPPSCGTGAHAQSTARRSQAHGRSIAHTEHAHRNCRIIATNAQCSAVQRGRVIAHRLPRARARAELSPASRQVTPAAPCTAQGAASAVVRVSGSRDMQLQPAGQLAVSPLLCWVVLRCAALLSESEREVLSTVQPALSIRPRPRPPASATVAAAAAGFAAALRGLAIFARLGLPFCVFACSSELPARERAGHFASAPALRVSRACSRCSCCPSRFSPIERLKAGCGSGWMCLHSSKRTVAAAAAASFFCAVPWCALLDSAAPRSPCDSRRWFRNASAQPVLVGSA